MISKQRTCVTLSGQLTIATYIAEHMQSLTMRLAGLHLAIQSSNKKLIYRHEVIKLNSMAQVYKITNIKNKKIYIGISVASDGSAMTRFAKHMAGEGGVWIRRDVESGNAHPSDFEVDILEESDDVEYIADREIYYIEFYDSLHPKGYNGNKGNFIVQTEETIAKAKTTRAKHIAEGKINTKGINLGRAIYRYPDGTLKSLPTTHEDVVNNIVKHVNYDPDSKSQIKKRSEDEQRQRNGGLTDKELLRRELNRELWKHVHTTEWWKRGRETFRDRMNRKEFTDSEKELYYERRPDIVKAHWKKLDRETRAERTSPGLARMNGQKQECEHCGFITSIGNYKRWHGKNCKQRPCT